MNQAGIVMDGLTSASAENKAQENKATPKTNKPSAKKDDLTALTTEQLNEKLQQYLENEEYEKAAAVRDELTRRE